MSPAVPRPPPDFGELELGRDAEVFELDGLEACRAVTASLLRQFRQSVEIVTRDLDPRLYDDGDLLASIRGTVASNRRSRVRVLLRDPGVPVRRGHRMLDLAARLSSFIELRVLAPQHADFNEAMLVVDGVGSVHRLLGDRYEGNACFASRPIAGNLLRVFEEMWGVAKPDPGLRNLHI